MKRPLYPSELAEIASLVDAWASGGAPLRAYGGELARLAESRGLLRWQMSDRSDVGKACVIGHLLGAPNSPIKSYTCGNTRRYVCPKAATPLA